LSTRTTASPATSPSARPLRRFFSRYS